MDTLIQQISPMLYDTAKQTGAVALLDMSGVKQKINFGDSTIANIGSNGTLYYSADDLVRYVSTGKSEILEMDLYKIGDGIGFNSILFAVVDGFKLNKMAYDQIQRFSPLDNSINANMARAGSMVVVKTIANIIRLTNKNTPHSNICSIQFLLSSNRRRRSKYFFHVFF